MVIAEIALGAAAREMTLAGKMLDRHDGNHLHLIRDIGTTHKRAHRRFYLLLDGYFRQRSIVSYLFINRLTIVI